MFLSDENEGFLETLAALASICVLWLLLTILALTYMIRRIKYLERLQTTESQAEVQRIRALSNGPFRNLNPKIITFASTDLSKAVYERLSRVFGMVVIIVCSLTSTFWRRVRGLWRPSKEPGVMDVELAAYRADEGRGGTPLNRRDDVRVPKAANPPGE